MTDTSENSFSLTQRNAAVKGYYFDPNLRYSDPKQGIDFKQLGFPYTGNLFKKFWNFVFSIKSNKKMPSKRKDI